MVVNKNKNKNEKDSVNIKENMTNAQQNNKIQEQADKKEGNTEFNNTSSEQTSNTLTTGAFLLEKIRTNPWIISTFIIGLAFLALIFFNISGSSTTTGNVVNEKQIEAKILDFVKQRSPSGAQDIQIVSTQRTGEVYKVDLSFQGEKFPIYVTLDGKYLIGDLIPLDIPLQQNLTNTSSDNQAGNEEKAVPKTDKPKVELFVMSHCPFGLQMEKGIIPVISLLKDKIDFELKFVYYAMHGEKEVREQLNQYCIQKEQKAKLIPYLTCFIEAGDSEKCLTNVSIDRNKLSQCVNKTDADFKIIENLNDKSKWLNGRFPEFSIYKSDNDKYNVAGSPTLVINGVEVSTARNPQALLNKICDAFTSKPGECSTTLATSNPSAGFGWGGASAQAASDASCG